MNRVVWMRRYVKLSIIIGFVLLWVVARYVNNFPSELYGEVHKSVFIIDIENYFGTVSILNLPLIVFVVISLGNLAIQFFVAKEIDEETSLKDVAITNTMVSVAMIFGQILFILLVPEIINGEINNRIFFVEMPRQIDNVVLVFNTNYVFAFGYVLYNMFILVVTMPPKEEQPEDIDVELIE